MSLEQTIGNLDIRYANTITFVGSSNTMVDTTTGRIQTKGIQHNSNVITDISGPHGRVAPTLKKYPEIIFEEGKFDANDSTNTYVQAGYTVTASSQASQITRNPWSAFDDVDLTHQEFAYTMNLYDGSDGTNPGFATTNAALTTNVDGSGTYRGEWLQLQLPNKIKINKYVLGKRAHQFGGLITKEGKILASNDGINWTTIYDHNDTGDLYSVSTTSIERRTFQVNSSSYYNYFRLATNKLFPTGLGTGTTMTPNIAVWELYGTEEYTPAGDHSVDTTFMSRFNNPQLTGVQVLVDGATGLGTNQISGGVDPSGNQANMTSPNKYWTLNGTLTSNITVEANTFLEGDQPHAVSMWFNSSNLEANVSNTCVFSISDQEKLDSQNLDLQSNTWHNLTYTYQGEGGSKVTYLDGRKVAEDQAEDTFGEYPPFEMTGYSQGGYVVSSTTNYYDAGNPLYPWQVFNDSNNNRYQSIRSDYSSSTGNYTGTVNQTTVDGSLVGGEWVQLELPNKISLNRFTVALNMGSHGGRMGRSYVLAGSNNGSTWTTVSTHTQSYGNGGDGNDVNHTVNSTTTYKYYRLIATSTFHNTQANGGSWALSRWKLYGHRENDLVRLPDPTNVLKYPHFYFGNKTTDTAPARRGYVISSSGEYQNGADANHRMWRPFHDLSGDGSWLTDESPATFDNASPGSAATSANFLGGITGVSGNRNGPWLKLELPHKIKFSYAHIYKRNHPSLNPGIKTGYIYGSNDDSTWTTIGTINESSPSYTATTPLIVTSTDTTNAYKYIVIQVTLMDSQNSVFGLGQLEYYGTGVDSIPLQIGGGNIDKVANFRVYDKFVGEDQALEIWDAQKDEFGRAKSQMVLQQGKLGVGTDAPQGRFSVADEPHNLEEFPPRAMTGYKNYFEGHGEFCASASSWYNQSVSTDPIYPWSAFNKGALGFSTGNGYGNNWEPATPATYSTSTGLYTGASGFFTAGIGGDWVQLELPYAITLDHMEFMPAYYNNGSHIPLGVARSPKDGHIMASNDGIIWISIYNWTGRTDFTQLEYTTFKVPETVTKTYKYFRVVWTRTNSTAPSAGSYAAYATAGEIKFFGTREQGQSVLHDGQLTLTKNLNVPRIGPALDADDTPRRDRLVVEYNTSTNPTFEGAVRDTSGRGLDGIMKGLAIYDATKKALVFDGATGATSSVIEVGEITNYNTNWVHSVSVWLNMHSPANYETVYSFGDPTAAARNNIAIHIANTQFLAESTGGSSTKYWNIIGGAWKVGTWEHFVFVRDGSLAGVEGFKIYQNGVELASTGGTNASTAIIIPRTSTFRIGQRITSANDQPYDGDLSQFKLYDTALTAEEVKTLYDMGRTGSVANPQPLHIAAPLYSPGTTVQLVHRHVYDYHTVNSNNGLITPMNTSITPKFSSSKILVQMMVNGEGHHDATFRILRYIDGSSTGVHMPPDTVQTPAHTDGIAPVTYDGDNNSTMGSVHIMFVDTPNTTGIVEYKLYYKWRDSSSVNRFSLNQVHADATASYTYGEHTSSSVVLQEIAH
jgi:hypothetical protein